VADLDPHLIPPSATSPRDPAAGPHDIMYRMSTRIAVADLALLDRAMDKFMGAKASGAYTAAPGTMTFVALAGPEIAGWCWGYQLVRPHDTLMLYLHQIEVDQAHRRTGIGRDLLRTFMTAGARAGATKMFLTTGADNAPARSLYESLGGGLASQGPTVNYWFLLDQ
jgi:ribosomal protein S18 acetylase RimI-like enzyme